MFHNTHTRRLVVNVLGITTCSLVAILLAYRAFRHFREKILRMRHKQEATEA
jgi:hypothetical protein